MVDVSDDWDMAAARAKFAAKVDTAARPRVRIGRSASTAVSMDAACVQRDAPSI